MRRPLTLLAIALVLLGIEVATGAVSLAAVRLWLGLTAVTTGGQFLLPTPRFVVGCAILLGGVVLFGGVAWVEVARRKIVPDASSCPKCGMHTKRVRRRKRHRILSRMIETNVTHRYCERCGWRGLSA